MEYNLFSDHLTWCSLILMLSAVFTDVMCSKIISFSLIQLSWTYLLVVLCPPPSSPTSPKASRSVQSTPPPGCHTPPPWQGGSSHTTVRLPSATAASIHQLPIRESNHDLLLFFRRARRKQSHHPQRHHSCCQGDGQSWVRPGGSGPDVAEDHHPQRLHR